MTQQAHSRSALDALCTRFGVVSEYADIWGNRQRASDATRIALLKALGAIEDESDIEGAVQRHEALAWREVVPRAAVFAVDEAPYRMRFRFPETQSGTTYNWTFDIEGEGRRDGVFRPSDLATVDRAEIDGERYVEVAFDWNDRLPYGYHRYTLEGPGLSADDWVMLIVGPASCYLPPAIEAGARVWGPVVQLYSVRSERNWGMGDYTDLKSVVERWGQRGAGVVGANPLHALYPHNPLHMSPYSPSSRLFFNVIYIDVEAVPDARESAEVLAAMGTAGFQTKLQAARGSELVDYAAISALKFPLLELAYRHFRQHHLEPDAERGRAFRDFQKHGGERLRRHALFEALQEHFHRQDQSMWGWPVWPEAYRRPDAPEVTQFAQDNVERIEHYEYLQWQAALQLSRANARADELGYGVGVYQDLAISIDRGGAESWANQEVYAVGASVGAPPDEVNLKGQNWGLPPLRPEALKHARYGPFIDTLRATMRYAGALRIDHVMGLYRLYWIPPGASAAEGAYVCYPFKDLVTILALESRRNECMVIGEDLGTVPDEVREGLSRGHVMSYRLMMFERDKDGEYLPPDVYPDNALVAVSTHDLGTLTGWWEGRDMEVRQALDLFPSEEVRRKFVAGRVQERARLVKALEREKLVEPGAIDPDESPMTPELSRAVHEYLARSPSRLMGVQPEDVLLVREQANMPGTVDEHPNWRRKLPISLEEMDRDPRCLEMTAMLQRVRPSPETARPKPGELQAKIPRCTYRLQLNAGYTLNDATALIPYLARLGVSHLYCSPYLKARPGSTHGYDIIDHNALNPEIGTAEDFERFVETLSQHGMGHILDMVPNHMGVMGADNAWWLDVLENGPASAYADFFDIEWHPANPALEGKVLVPVLGDQYGHVLERGELNLSFHAKRGEFFVCYYDHRFPLAPRQYRTILEAAAATLHGDVPADAKAELESIASGFQNLPTRRETDVEKKLRRQRDKEVHKRQLARLAAEHEGVANAVDRAVQALNGRPGDAASFEKLHGMLEQQAYRLSSWRVAADEINYRRFFDINDLAALRMEHEHVFDATHRFVLKLCAEGKVDGLRIDHPDGLYDPEQYFRRLQERYAQAADIVAEPGEDGRPPRPLYVVIEKIAASHEKMPESWAVYGTSGYRFATVVNNVLVDCTAADEMERVYRAFAPEAEDYEESVHDGKRAVQRAALSAPLMMLATELSRVALADRRTRDYTLNSLRRALAEVVACFPVYRTYIVDGPSAQDRRYIEWAVAQARRRSRAADTAIFEFLRRTLLAEAPEDAPPALRERIRAFAMKVQQFTAPVTAKGIEDTAFYRYNRLVSLNDVGGDPGQFGMPVSAFHGASAERGAHRPHTMLGTSTHDNKRSEDVRTRIDVLSEMPAEWRALLKRWERMNRSKKTAVEDKPAPSSNDEYLLYQVLLGSYAQESGDALETYRERIQAYMQKALREAKVHTSWINPNEDYESAVSAFVAALLAAGGRNLFLKDLAGKSATLAWFGMLNSLSMTLIKLTSPGVPDIYQGNEIADLSLVDPDNRRPVDYGKRAEMLDRIERSAQSANVARDARALAASGLDGRGKLWIVSRVLSHRRDHADLFRHGDYLPLHAHGEHADHVIAYLRRHRGRSMVVIAGRLFRKLGTEEGKLPLGQAIWGDTAIESGPLARPLTNLLTGETVEVKDGRIRLADAFRSFPGAVLV
ncbi:MAG TPA: malto-oligosyltrehalose synthase [Burkholderiales bacterium]|nr:malto-oligosyltrehalose synthase [Burkholderiales bacterium]